MAIPSKNKSSRANEWLPPIEAFQKTKHSVIEGEHPATLAEEVFLKQVTLDFGRSSGPGGQHRNRKATSCTATHIPSDISGEATERRRQSENRKMAVSRLRRTLATLLRCKLNLASYTPSELWESRRQGDQFPINSKHDDYPAVLSEALDVLFASKFDMAKAANSLQISKSQIKKLVSGDNPAFTWVNDQRKERDLHPLRP
jgi:hypothetical protein